MSRLTHPWSVLLGLVALACASVLVVVVIPGSHLPAGDGAHLLAAGWRIGASAAPVDDLLHRITPHPPFAYLLPALSVPLVGPRTTMAVQSALGLGGLALGLRWIRPTVHLSALLAGWSLIASSSVVWWSTDQFALDWPAAALVVLGLGAMVRALEPGRKGPAWRRGGIVALLLLLPVFTKYTSVLPLAGGIAVAVLAGGWKRPVTRWAAATVTVVGAAWLLWALDDLTAYGATTMSESGAGGPGGAVNQDPDLSVTERLSAARIGRWAMALRDNLGAAPLALVLLGIAGTRLRDTGSRIAATGALLPLLVLPLTRIQPQPRYLLVSAVLLVAAALPSPRQPRRHLFTGICTVLAIISVIYNASLYRNLPPEDRPGHRDAAPTAGLGDWPWPAAPSWPIRSRVESRGTLEALQALDAQLPAGETAALVRFDRDPERPSWAAIDLVARTADIEREWVVAESPQGQLLTPPGMQAPEWVWVSWTDATAAPALAWVQTHANLEQAITWWSSDGTGGVVLPLGAHTHHHP